MIGKSQSKKKRDPQILEASRDSETEEDTATSEGNFSAVFGPRDQFAALEFNQDASCIALGHKDGFRVYMSDPLRCQFERCDLGSIKTVELLFRNQIIALVSGPDNKRFPNTKVIIWDDYQLRQIDEIKVSQPVLAVKLRRDRVVVVMRNSVNWYNLGGEMADFAFMGQLQTVDNPKGIVALNYTTDAFILAVPSVHSANTVFIQMVNQKSVYTNQEIEAHRSPISQLCLSIDGRYLATCSDRGTRVKVFETQTLRELRRFRFSIKQAVIS